jgi:tetratricopeptide (TPR) repeat protein
LAPGASRALLTELRRDDPLPPDLTSDLIERSGGNPYLLERLAAAAGWEDHLPGNVEAAAATQLDHLDPAEREVLLDLAVLGRRFDPDLAEEVVGVGDWSVFADFLQAEWDGRLRFRQPILHDAAYASLPAGRRRDLHRRTGIALAGRSTSTEVLSEHFSRAGADKETWETGRLAGKRALERNAPLEAATLLARALASAHRMASLPIAPRAEAAELLGDAWCQAGHLEEGEKAYLAAEELAKTRGDRARLLHKRALLRKREGRYPAALRMITTALKSLPKAAGPGERAELELGYAGVRLHQGRYREAIERCDRAILLAEKAGDLATLGGAYVVKGRAASQAGSGVEDAERALGIFESTGDHLMQARVLDLLGGDAYDRGDWNEALTLEGRSAEQRELAGDAVGSAVAGYHRARVLLDQGRLDRAESALEEIRTASRAANHPLGVAKSTMHLASAVARGGDSAAALGMLKETRDLFEELDAGRCVIANRLAQAEAHLLGGGVEAAIADAEEALRDASGIVGADVTVIGLQRVRGVALVWLGRSRDGHVQLLEAAELARRADAAFEQALILDALATLYGDDGASEERNAIVERLGIVRLPPFLTVS